MKYLIGGAIVFAGIVVVAMAVAIGEARRINKGFSWDEIVDHEYQRGIKELERIANGE